MGPMPNSLPLQRAPFSQPPFISPECCSVLSPVALLLKSTQPHAEHSIITLLLFLVPTGGSEFLIFFFF